MTTQPAPEKTPDSKPPVAPVAAGDRPRRSVLRRLVRWLLWLAVIAAAGAGIYYAWPVVQERVLQPVEANTVQVGALAERITAVEDRLVQLEARAAAAEADLETVRAAGEETAGDAAALGGRIAELDRRIAALEQTADQLQTRVEEVGSGFAEELAVLRAMELMSRARLFLYQANYGLAAADLRAARAVLTEHAGTSRIDEALTRIDMALAALPARPVAAADDLDIAWEVLLGDPALASPPTPATATTAP